MPNTSQNVSLFLPTEKKILLLKILWKYMEKHRHIVLWEVLKGTSTFLGLTCN